MCTKNISSLIFVCYKLVWALRINFGQGYRVYYSIENEFIILLLVGGNKSTQQADIDKAVNYLEDYHVRMKNDQ